ncbi:SDR family NAD(P)-dependent oxidoreductase [Leucobacter weissii]|uniref:SDR family NAD(P)-dependent oxidoreductase n=1 Tax=Leucobacter weissii TaxID=1983706 RepID=A0A939MPR8_9MICO|nr:SDR family NAD(P)-dependent oxidoreductase [Leucobacter weissii]MBO1902482.1 SDR family NAD(P)-dependent oxidoreductase [Leucobacter weissii]
MDKKIILVTGATSGLGREEAKAFLTQGHTVILHGRNRDKALTVQKELIAETGNPDVDVMIADLESLASVKALAEQVAGKYDRLDVLVNNAGNQYGGTWQPTAEGHEKTMTVNLFAPVLLSLLLVDSLARSPHGRIVTVSSASHAQGGRPYLDDIELKDHYSYTRAYGLSKLYVIWAMRALRKDLLARGIITIDVNTTHPGTAKTSLGEADQRPFLMKVLFAVFVPLFGTTAEKGAQPTIYAATSPEAEGLSDRYYGPKGQEKVSERHHTPASEKAVWDYCLTVLTPYLP